MVLCWGPWWQCTNQPRSEKQEMQNWSAAMQCTSQSMSDSKMPITYGRTLMFLTRSSKYLEAARSTTDNVPTLPHPKPSPAANNARQSILHTYTAMLSFVNRGQKTSFEPPAAVASTRVLYQTPQNSPTMTRAGVYLALRKNTQRAGGFAESHAPRSAQGSRKDKGSFSATPFSATDSAALTKLKAPL